MIMFAHIPATGSPATEDRGSPLSRGAPRQTATAVPAETPDPTPADTGPPPDGHLAPRSDVPAETPTATPTETERLGDEIARLAAHLHAATYQLLILIRAFDEREGWTGGFLSCAHWLSWRVGIAPGAAREKVRVARALGPLPLISEAMARGELSYSKVRALTRVATPENEAELLEVARHATAVHIERLVRAWRRVGRQEDAELERERHRSRYLRLYPDDDGMWVLQGRLDPEVGALLEKALEWASEALYRAEESHAEMPFAQRRADAVGLLAERWMAMGESVADESSENAGKDGTENANSHQAASETDAATVPLGRADRFQVVVHVDAETLEERSVEGDAEIGDSATHLPVATARRLACDAGLVHMTHDSEGNVLDVGRKTRTVPPAIRRALGQRDQGCRFPGCGLRYTDAHHIVHWADGGETKLDNLVLLCRRHHRAVHEEGFGLEVVEAGLQFSHPDGSLIPEVPEVPEVPNTPADPVRALERAHSERGFEPDAWTPTPLWNGEPFDVGMALEGLMPLTGPLPRGRRD